MSDNRYPLVSVIINCYNGELYLEEAIDSVLNQTYKNWEIIFWDNKSIDSSAKIVKNYTDKRIKYYKSSTHTSLGKARNKSINYASGEWCAFLDCDDLWTSEKLQKQIDIANNNNVGLIYGRMSVFSKNNNYSSNWSNRMIKNKNNLTNSLPEGEIFDKLLQHNFIPLLTAIFRRDLFSQIGGISEHMEIAEDYDLFVKLSRLTRACVVREVVAYYRVHENNLSIGRQEQDFSETIEIVSRYLPLDGAIQALKVHHSFRSIQQIRDGEILKGFYRFLSNGSLRSLFLLFLKRY
jgi:glycosyltransferase involved in cell wall biosynthesis